MHKSKKQKSVIQQKLKTKNPALSLCIRYHCSYLRDYVRMGLAKAVWLCHARRIPRFSLPPLCGTRRVGWLAAALVSHPSAF